MSIYHCSDFPDKGRGTGKGRETRYAKEGNGKVRKEEGLGLFSFTLPHRSDSFFIGAISPSLIVISVNTQSDAKRNHSC